MNKYDTIAFRLTLMVFILLFLTIAILLILVNNQMNTHFSQYLQMNHMMMGHGGRMMHGFAEETYISAVHQSLLWVGLGMVVLSVAISYVVIKAMTRPLSTLTEAVRSIGRGDYGKTVPIERRDEVGLLSETFNDMSRQLQKNDHMRRQLFANIAHELRTPLAILQGNLEGMIDDVIPCDKKMLLSMEDETLRLSRLVQDLRDLSLAEVNELVLHKQNTDMNTLLRRAVSMMEPLLDEKSLHLTLHLEEPLPLASMDPDRMNQVIYNILNNAIRYIPDGSSIAIYTKVVTLNQKRYIKTIISDTGPGISKEDLKQIFQYFYRGEKSRNRQSGGSGIGLALARQFVISHGGTIEAFSTEGKGTSFVFHMPIDSHS